MFYYSTVFNHMRFCRPNFYTNVLLLLFRSYLLRIIKMSSPNLNNVIVAGFMLAYVCVIVIGLDLPLITKGFLRTMCEVIKHYSEWKGAREHRRFLYRTSFSAILFL